MPSYPSGLRFETIVVPTPFAVGAANVYVITADPVTLIDCGPNTEAAERALRAGMTSMGIELARIDRVVISHGHPDHYGLAPWLQQVAGAEVLVGELDRPKLADASTLALTGRLLLKAGMPMATLTGMGSGEEHFDRPLRPMVPEAVPVSGGDRLAFDGFDLELLHLPGHTGGHICPYDPETGVLFCGDTLLLEISPNPLLEPDPKDPRERRQSLVEYLRTLDTLSAMPLSTGYPGHGPVIEHPHDVIEEMRAHHRERVEEVAARLTPQGKTGWELATELFPNVEGFDNFLALSEILAHLDLLVVQGRAEVEERNRVTYFRPRG